MLTKHPKTGKDIRILNTDASRWKDQKTLAFSSTVTPWDSIWTGPLEDGTLPTFYLLLGKDSKKVPALKSQYVFTEYTNAQTNTYGYIPLEDLHLSFPQLGTAWDGTAKDAAAMISHLFHYQRFYSHIKPSRLQIPFHTTPPEPLWLITQMYSSTVERTNELETCLKMNVENPLISGILLLNETQCKYTNPKIKQTVIGHRITYRDVMEAINTLPANALVAFANADIALDPVSWRSLWSVNLKEVCIALLRYDVTSRLEDATLFGPRADSQDTWVVRAEDVHARPLLLSSLFDIPFGKMGCDNVFALEMLRQKFCIINPCYSLITWHFHSSGIRTYNKDDVIDRPMFHYVHPSGLHDMNPCLELKPFITHTYEPITLYRPIRGSGATAWIHSMGKTNASTWKLESTNPLTLDKEIVLHLTNVYQTPQGLVYDSRNMYVGKGKDAASTWATYPIKPLLATLKSEKGFVVPWPKELNTKEGQREIYILKYLSKVLRLRELSGWKQGDFFCIDIPGIQNAMKLFRWGGPLPLIKYESDIQVWHEEAYVFPIEEYRINPKDIQALRLGLGPFWKETVGDEKTIILVEGGSLIGKIDDIEEKLENMFKVFVVYPGKTSPERLLACLSGAWGIVCPSGIEASGWNWMLPKGAHVFEIDSSDDVSLDISATSYLEHHFTDVKNILEEICSLPLYISNTLNIAPIVWIPRQIEGYFSHEGDGFRELLRMWNVKGYIQMKEHSTATMCWWGEVGSILLYDRPTQAWRLSAPMPEREYTRMLVRGSDWILWARNPSIVEDFVNQDFHTNPWEKRRGFADTTLNAQESLVSFSNSLYMVWNGQKEFLVEALAMGCVPIMDTSDILIEGEHYVKEDTLSREEWERISKNCHHAWKTRYSCEGSFCVTKEILSSSK